MTVVSYQDIDSLRNYFFEDSYVLAIHVFAGRLSIELDVILTNSHPHYVSQKDGEQYCFRKAVLIFDQVTSITHFFLNYDIATDVDDEKDMGNIDYLSMEGGNLFHISGPWGNIDLIADSVSVDLS